MVPAEKVQRNFTDPESRVVKTSNKGPNQRGNARAVVNEEQIIVSRNVTDQFDDVRQPDPMLQQTIKNMDTAGVVNDINAFTGDVVYFSENNVGILKSNDRVSDAFLATGRLKHNQRIPADPRGHLPHVQTRDNRRPESRSGTSHHSPETSINRE